MPPSRDYHRKASYARRQQGDRVRVETRLFDQDKTKALPSRPRCQLKCIKSGAQALTKFEMTHVRTTSF